MSLHCLGVANNAELFSAPLGAIAHVGALIKPSVLVILGPSLQTASTSRDPAVHITVESRSFNSGRGSVLRGRLVTEPSLPKYGLVRESLVRACLHFFGVARFHLPFVSSVVDFCLHSAR
jgi:hypothetical protein